MTRLADYLRNSDIDSKFKIVNSGNKIIACGSRLLSPEHKYCDNMIFEPAGTVSIRCYKCAVIHEYSPTIFDLSIIKLIPIII
jgi:hypothetical protein